MLHSNPSQSQTTSCVTAALLDRQQANVVAACTCVAVCFLSWQIEYTQPHRHLECNSLICIVSCFPAICIASTGALELLFKMRTWLAGSGDSSHQQHHCEWHLLQGQLCPDSVWPRSQVVQWQPQLPGIPAAHSCKLCHQCTHCSAIQPLSEQHQLCGCYSEQWAQPD